MPHPIQYLNEMIGDRVKEYRSKIVEHVLRQPIRKILLRHVAAVVGVGAGLAALDGDAAGAHPRRACLWGVPNRGAYPPDRGEPSGVSLKGQGQGPTARIL